MRRAIVVALGTGAFISSAAALSIGGIEDAREISRGEYERSMHALKAEGSRQESRCDALSAAPDKDSCRAEAQANELVRVAEIEQGYRRSEQSARALQRARIDARYQVERARCGALGGFKREQCLVKTHAARGRALLESGAAYETRF